MRSSTVCCAALILLGRANVDAQRGPPPDGGSTSSGVSCDGCGGSSTYSESIMTDSGYSKRTITANGCPNHCEWPSWRARVRSPPPLDLGVCTSPPDTRLREVPNPAGLHRCSSFVTPCDSVRRLDLHGEGRRHRLRRRRAGGHRLGGERAGQDDRDSGRTHHRDLDHRRRMRRASSARRFRRRRRRCRRATLLSHLHHHRRRARWSSRISSPPNNLTCSARARAAVRSLTNRKTDSPCARAGADPPPPPVLRRSAAVKPCAKMGAIAIALNGVSIYSGAVDNQCTQVDVEDSTSEWSGFDFCSGHAEMTGDYHYHFPPSCLLDQAATATGANASSHSPQIGWACVRGAPPLARRGGYADEFSRASSPPARAGVTPSHGVERRDPSVQRRGGETTRPPHATCRVRAPFTTTFASRQVRRLSDLRPARAGRRHDDPHRRRLRRRLLSRQLLWPGGHAPRDRQLQVRVRARLAAARSQGTQTQARRGLAFGAETRRRTAQTTNRRIAVGGARCRGLFVGAAATRPLVTRLSSTSGLSGVDDDRGVVGLLLALCAPAHAPPPRDSIRPPPPPRAERSPPPPPSALAF